MSFIDYLKEVETVTPFPSDEEISKAAIKADEIFWRSIVDSFKDKLETKDFIMGKELEDFKAQEIIAIKNWLKDNWPEPSDKNSDKPRIIDFKGGIIKTQNPPIKTSGGAYGEPSTAGAANTQPAPQYK